MPTRLLVVVLVLVCLVAIAPPTGAAPPTLNYLFPAGGQRGTTVTVTADGTFAPWPVQAWASGKGIDVKPAKQVGKLIVTVAADAIPGTYALRLYNEDGASGLRPFFVGTLPEVFEQEPNDDLKKPQVLASTSVVINGRLDKAGDVDTFALALKKGQTLVASQEAHHTLRSPMDGHLQVVTPEGFVLEHSDDYHGLDPQVVFPVPRDGTYLVRTFAFPAVPDSSIRFAGGDKFIYRLTLTTGAFFDYAYPLAVARTSPAPVSMIGWNLPPAMRTLAPQQEDRLARATVFHPDCANAVQVRVEPHPSIVKAPTASRTQPQAIDVPFTISGRLERAGDVDVFQFTGKKGQKLAVRAEAQTLGFPLDPVLTITDRAGKSLARAQAGALGKDPTLDFTVPQDGLYTLDVADLHGLGSARHVYRLQARAQDPDFALKLPTDRLVVPPGKPLDIAVSVERSYGFAKDIDLALEGLPPGVTATTLPGTPTKKAATLTLRLTANQAPFSGAVRLVGTTKDGLMRVGTATLVDLATATDNLWLTVGKGK